MPQNYLQAFRGPSRAQIDRDVYSNALLQEEASRAPQRARMQDLQIQSQEMQIGDAQRKNATGVLGRNFAMIAASPRPREAARAFLSTPDFQAAGKLAGLPVEQFTITDQDTDDVIRQQAQAWAEALSGSTQQRRVQSTFVGRNGNQWYMTADGQAVDTGIPVSQFAQRPVETGAGIEAFDPARGTTGGPVSPAATAPALDAAALARKEAEAIGSGRGQAQAEREASAPQRAERARQQITTIDNVLGMANRALSNVNWSTVGAAGALSKAVPGTPAYDLNQTLLTIKANLGFDRLQQMRESSPTGGALGQVAVQELSALQAAVASLDQAQSGEQLRQNIQSVIQHYENWKRVIQQAQGGMAPINAPQVGEIVDGYRYKGGNPALESSWERQ